MIQDPRPGPRCTLLHALLVQLGRGVPSVEVADVDEEVEEFHYGNAATARRICILEGRRARAGGQAGRPPFNSRPTEVNLGKDVK